MDETLTTQVQEENLENVVLESEKETFNVSQDDLLNAYKELQALKATNTDTNKETLSEDTITKITDIVKANNGVLNETDYASFKEQGYSKDFIDTYIEGIKSKETEAFKTLLSPYGSLEDYADAVVYVQNNWTEAQINAYNKAINSGDEDIRSFAIQSIMGTVKGSKKETKEENTMITDTRPSRGSFKGYETQSDMIKDMRSPKYGKDVAYTRKVEERMALTDLSAFN